ncbi:MAG: hypothetical protein UZ17_ACD001002605 [Acidobacteria bacterium OLB17]|nr:MAG: hypothetical protein UZ17_ACD001002605 [Acidobacteria bacterium OLB17]MCZ2390347.1 hypothetical protein [Acidobacteriota bacterium]
MDQQDISPTADAFAGEKRRAVSFAVIFAVAAFIAYSIWAVREADHYYFLGGGANYLSPLFSPELFGDSPQGLFGARPAWMPAWLPASPALLFLWLIGLAAVRRAVKECDCFILLIVERLLAFVGVAYLAALFYDAFCSVWFLSNMGRDVFGIRGGTVIIFASCLSVLVCLTALFSAPTGRFGRLARNRSRITAITLLILAAADLYIRLCSMGKMLDVSIF